MRLLELFELQAQEGPCLDAFRTGERVEHENLDAGSGRWPSFSAAAIEAGFLSALALPLRLRDVTLGALNLLGTARTSMSEADVIVARAFADLATLSILQHRASAESQRLNEQLSAALTSRVVIEQAKGVISERAGLHLDQAFTRLRAYARNQNLRLTDVARAATDGTLDPLAWAPQAHGNLPLTSPPADGKAIGYRDDLAAVRRFTAVQARQAGLPPARVDDLVIAVNELAANTFAHTAGPGMLTIWSTLREVICQVSDTGHITDPLAGTRPSRSEGPGGHLGLWVAQQICDLAEIQTSPAGTTIRLHMLLD
jgi:anti-sigma regulatory factor (Ser/Thr protein kinase)